MSITSLQSIPNTHRTRGSQSDRLTDDATLHGSMECLKVNTTLGNIPTTRKKGAGFTSVANHDGNDWISYRPSGRSRETRPAQVGQPGSSSTADMAFALSLVQRHSPADRREGRCGFSPGPNKDRLSLVLVDLFPFRDGHAAKTRARRLTGSSTRAPGGNLEVPRRLRRSARRSIDAALGPGDNNVPWVRWGPPGK